MKDDFSSIETGSSCYVLNNATTIYSYKNSVRTTYIQVGGKWYKNAVSNYYDIPNNAVCWSYSDITSLNSNAAFEPIYLMIAFCLSIFVWFFVFRLVSKLFRWRV